MLFRQRRKANTEKVTLTTQDIATVSAEQLTGPDWATLSKQDDWKGNPDGTPKVVEATSAMHGHGSLGFGEKLNIVLGPAEVAEIVAYGGAPPTRAQKIEAAMAKAIEECAAEGIPMTDSATVHARMMAARQRVIDEG